jgi:hypothetical protein
MPYKKMIDFSRDKVKVVNINELYLKYLDDTKCIFVYLCESQVCGLIELLLIVGKHRNTRRVSSER